MENNFVNNDSFTVKTIEGQPVVSMTLDQTIDAVKTMFDLVVADKEGKNTRTQSERVMVLSLWGSTLVHLAALKEKESIPIVKADWYNAEQ